MAQNGPSAEEARRHAERGARKTSPWIERLARAGYVAYGVVYALVGVLAVQAAFGGSGETASQEGALRRRWLAAVAGAVIVGAGIYQFYKAYQADFRDDLKTGEMSAREKKWTTRSGRLGYAARGVVFGVIGVFLVQAALQTDPDEARGLGGALETLARQPLGPYILGAVAIGLVAYGVFMFVMARYRRIEPA